MNEQILYALGTGILGIFVHTLMKIDKINKRSKGKIKLRSFFSLELPSILISVSIVVVAIIAREEIGQLKAVGNYLLLGFFCIGLSAQTIAYYISGRLERKMAKREKEEDNTNKIDEAIHTIGAGTIGLPKPNKPGGK